MHKNKYIKAFIPLFKWNDTSSNWKKVSIIAETTIAVWAYGAIISFLYIILFYKNISYNQNIYFYFPDFQKNSISYKQAKKQYLFLETDPLDNDITGARVFYIDRLAFSWITYPAIISNIIRYGLSNDGYVGAVTIPGSIILINRDLPIYKLDNNDGYSNLAHELVHVIQHQKYGFFSSIFFTQQWVNEGYPTFRMSLYNGNSIDELNVNSNYKFYAKLVKHGIQEMGKTPDELHKGEVSYKEVLFSLCQVGNTIGCSNEE